MVPPMLARALPAIWGSCCPLRACMRARVRACRIALEDPLQATLSNNYVGTRNVLQLAARRLRRLAAFVHVSTAFVNLNLPHNSAVRERIYPLMFGDTQVTRRRAPACLPACLPAPRRPAM